MRDDVLDCDVEEGAGREGKEHAGGFSTEGVEFGEDAGGDAFSL